MMVSYFVSVIDFYRLSDTLTDNKEITLAVDLDYYLIAVAQTAIFVGKVEKRISYIVHKEYRKDFKSTLKRR